MRWKFRCPVGTADMIKQAAQPEKCVHMRAGGKSSTNRAGSPIERPDSKFPPPLGAMPVNGRSAMDGRRPR